MIRSRRFALAAVVVVLGLSACGDPNTTTPLADQPKVIQLASGQGGSATAEAAPAAATMSAADSKMAFFGPTEFVYDGELPALDTPAGSWYFATGQQADLDRVAQLAAALGAEGDVRVLPEDQGGGWAVGPEDYSGTVLTVGADGMLSWWLSAIVPSTSPAIACGEGFAGRCRSRSRRRNRCRHTGGVCRRARGTRPDSPRARCPSPCAPHPSRPSACRPRMRRWPRPSSCSPTGATTSARTSSTSRTPTSGVQA